VEEERRRTEERRRAEEARIAEEARRAEEARVLAVWQQRERRGVAFRIDELRGLRARCGQGHTLEVEAGLNGARCAHCAEPLSVVARRQELLLCARSLPTHAFDARFDRCPVCFPMAVVDVACARCSVHHLATPAELEEPCPACGDANWFASLTPPRTSGAPRPASTSTPSSATSERGLRLALGTDLRVATPAELILGEAGTTNHHVLVGGRTGSGKSVFLHGLILQLAERYDTSQLQFHLVDLKGGVEFADYVDLPHVRSLNLVTSRLWAIDVLRAIDAECRARSALFVQHRVQEFADLRARGIVLPRLVLVIDEFHVLTGGHDALANEAQRLLHHLLRTARSFGIHFVLASQTASLQDIDASAAAQVGVRVAFRMSEADAVRVLGNPAAVTLERAGEFFVNLANGDAARNIRLQAPFVSPDERRRRVTILGARSLGERPSVLDPTRRTTAFVDGADVLVGRPLSIRSSTTVVRFTPERRSNLLVVGPRENAGEMAFAVVRQIRRRALGAVAVFDARPYLPMWGTVTASAQELERGALTRHLKALLDAPKAPEDPSDAAAIPRDFVVVPDLRPLLQGDVDREFNAVFQEVLQRGPERGVHVVAGVDSAKAADRLLAARLDDFGLRILFSVEDAGRLRPLNAQRLDDLETGTASLVTGDGETFFFPARYEEDR
jgi:hypothetical protein